MPEDAVTLTYRLRDGHLTVQEVATILDDVMGAVAATHARGLLERNLSPERVMVEAGRARLEECAAPPRTNRPEPSLQGFDVDLGRFAFMAPEQVRGSAKVDGRADVYAVGALAFFALTAKRPFRGGNALTLVAHKLDRAAPTLESIDGRAFPPLVELFVATALAIDPAKRYPSIGVAREAWRLACSLDVAA